MFEEIKLFSGLNDEELKTLSLFCQERELLKGELLFSEGEEASSVYILKEGLLEAFTFDKILGQIYPGELAGEISIFTGTNKRTASVRSLEDSKLIVLLAFSIEDLAKKHPDIMLKIKDVILRRSFENSLNTKED